MRRIGGEVMNPKARRGSVLGGQYETQALEAAGWQVRKVPDMARYVAKRGDISFSFGITGRCWQQGDSKSNPTGPMASEYAVKLLMENAGVTNS